MIPTYYEYEIVAAGLNQAITLNDCVDEYRLYVSAPVTLVGDVTITASGTPVSGDVIVFRYEGAVTLNGHTITIFGTELTQGEAMNKLRIEMRYDGSAWVAAMFQDVSRDATNYMAVRRNLWDGSGGTISLTPGINEYYQAFYTSGTVAAVGSYVVQVDPAATPVEGDMFIVKYDGNLTLGAQSLTIFGITVPAIQALGGNLEFRTIYDADTATWVSSCKVLLDNDIYRTMGSASDASPAYLDSKVAKSVVVAADKIELDGDVLAPGNGYYYGTDSTGAKGFHPIASDTLLHTEVQIDHADILTLFSKPVELISDPGVGKAISVVNSLCTIVGIGGAVTPYATYYNLRIMTDTATIEQSSNAFIVRSTKDRTTCLDAKSVKAPSDTQIIPNKSLYANIETGDPTGGAVGQYIKIKLIYRIIDIP